MEKAVNKSLFFQLIIGLCCFVWSSTLLAQNTLLRTKITITTENELVADILYKITSYYQVEFSYNSTIFKDNLNTSIDVSNTALYQVLDILLKDRNIIYSDVNGVIVLSKNIREPVVTNEIYGYIIDEATEKPIANANIFIANTTIGTTSDMDGSFRLSTNINGVHELIFSHISYSLIIKKLNLDLLDSNEFLVSMKEVTNELNEVIIESSQKEWKKNLKIFVNEFLGNTPNSNQCTILNPWILDFEYDS
jgi:carboxypeptidase-like protein